MVVGGGWDLCRVLGPFLAIYLCVGDMALDRHVHGENVVSGGVVWFLFWQVCQQTHFRGYLAARTVLYVFVCVQT
jgi:hypothetical protein